MSFQAYPLDQRVRHGLILKRLPKPPARILEVGVGDGLLIRELYTRGYKVSGCDVDLSPWTEAQKSKYQLTAADPGGRLDYDTDLFDAVFSSDVLEHVAPESREVFLEEMIRVARPGGVICVTAFFRFTFSFALWGGIFIVVSHSLPQWYKEHMEIPPPVEAETNRIMARYCNVVEIKRYQKALNLLTCAADCIRGPFGVVRGIAQVFSHIVPPLDFFGTPTSTMFCAVKRGPISPTTRPR